MSLNTVAQKRGNPNLLMDIPIPVSGKTLDIPTYREADNIPYAYWQFCKQKEKQLGLRSPETSGDSLIFRMWMTNPVGKLDQAHALVEIVKDSLDWQGQLIMMRVDYNKKEKKETVTRTKVYELRPFISDWQKVVDSLIYYRVETLPTDDQIPGYYTEAVMYRDYEPTFSFEYSTPTIYRFFQYNNVYRAMDRFWQPRNVEKILNILDREFHWYALSREFFQEKGKTATYK